MEAADPDQAIVATVRAGLRARLSHGFPRLSELAADLDIPMRTLQRRLAAAGMSYSSIVDSTRFQEALEHLREPTLSLSEIATALGYSDAAHFTRAFRRWSGKAPSEVRRELECDSAREEPRLG